MISTISIGGFKAFMADQTLELRPITLLFGANSSGKSSVLQSLLLLRQTIDEAESGTAALVPRGRLINLGSFSDMAFGKTSAIRLRAGLVGPFHFSSILADRALGLESFESLPTQEAWYEMVFGSSRSGVRVLELSIGGFGSPDPLFTFRLPERQGIPPGEMSPEAAATQSAKERRGIHELVNVAEDHPGIEVIRRYFAKTAADGGLGLNQAETNVLSKSLESMTPSEFVAAWRRAVHMEVLGLSGFLAARVVEREYEGADFQLTPDSSLPGLMRRAVRRQRVLSPAHWAIAVGRELRHGLGEIDYLGALRAAPERYYVANGTSVGGVGRSGQFTPDVLLSGGGIRKRVNAWLAQFGIPYTVQLTPVNKNDANDLFFLRIRDRDTGVGVSLVDVGVGVSQVLPVIVQAVISRNRTLLIEEPESHLHPRLQAALANLFLESSRKRGNRFLIETHSEHLILRLQRLIRTGDASPDFVSVAFAKKEANGARLYPLRLDTDGDFVDAWPEGFFPERLDELL
jgi:hypothetical protein